MTALRVARYAVAALTFGLAVGLGIGIGRAATADLLDRHKPDTSKAVTYDLTKQDGTHCIYHALIPREGRTPLNGQRLTAEADLDGHCPFAYHCGVTTSGGYACLPDGYTR